METLPETVKMSKQKLSIIYSFMEEEDQRISRLVGPDCKGSVNFEERVPADFILYATYKKISKQDKLSLTKDSNI